MDKFLQAVALIGLAVASAFFRFAVVVKLWGYIAVPMGAPPITIVQALGLGIICGVLTYEYVERPQGLEYASKAIFTTFLQTAFAWGIGYWIFG